MCAAPPTKALPGPGRSLGCILGWHPDPSSALPQASSCSCTGGTAAKHRAARPCPTFQVWFTRRENPSPISSALSPWMGLEYRQAQIPTSHTSMGLREQQRWSRRRREPSKELPMPTAFLLWGRKAPIQQNTPPTSSKGRGKQRSSSERSECSGMSSGMVLQEPRLLQEGWNRPSMELWVPTMGAVPSSCRTAFPITQQNHHSAPPQHSSAPSQPSQHPLGSGIPGTSKHGHVDNLITVPNAFSSTVPHISWSCAMQDDVLSSQSTPPDRDVLR